MILIDTSVWIDLLGSHPKRRVSAAEQSLVATCPPVVQEVLQGVRDDISHARIKAGLLALPRFADPVSVDLHLAAADLYRFVRRKGVTIRSSVDCLIAAVALEHDLTVWHDDRDYERLARMTRLRAHHGTTLG